MEKTVSRNPSLYERNLELAQENWGPLPQLEPMKVWEFCNTGKEGSLNIRNRETEKTLYFPDSIDVECQTWMNTLKQGWNNTLVLYGLGLGYYFYAIKSQLELDPERRLVFLEDDPEMLRAFLETDAVEEIISHPQVQMIFISKDEMLPAALGSKFTRPGFNGAILTGLLAYMVRKEAKFKKFTFFVDFVSSTHMKVMYEMTQGGLIYFRNYFSNFLNLNEGILGTELFGKFTGIPAIICGAGPSLGKHIPLLKTLKNKALIFAGGTAMNALTANGITPHFGAGIDPNYTQLSRVLENNALLVPYFVDMRMNSEARNALLGDVLYMPTNPISAYRIGIELEDEAGIPRSPPFVGGLNVVNYSLVLAHKLGCKLVLCVGLDLAYTEGASYAPNVRVHAAFDPVKELISKSPLDQLIIRNDIYGNPTQTLYNWVLESSWYEEYVAKAPELKVYNCTEGGIGLGSIENIPLKEAADKYLTQEFALDDKVRDEIKRARSFAMPGKAKLREVLMGFSSELSQFCAKLKKAEIEEKRELIEHELEKHDRLALYIENYKGLYEGDRKYRYLETLLQNLDSVLYHALMLDTEKHSAVLQPLVPQGAAVRYYEDGKTIQAVLPKNPDAYEGTFLYYYKNGQLKRSIDFHNGKRSGWDRFYDPKGQILVEAEYEEGLPKGVCKVFDSQGTLIRALRYKAPGVVEEVLRADAKGKLIPDLSHEKGYEKYAVKNIDLLSEYIAKLIKTIEQFEDSSDSSWKELHKELDLLKEIFNELRNLAGMDPEDYKELLWGSRTSNQMVANFILEASKSLEPNVLKIQESLERLLKQQNDKKL